MRLQPAVHQRVDARRGFAPLCAVLAFFISLALIPGGAPRAQAIRTIAVTPQFEHRQLFAIWKPIVAELEKRTGMRFKLVASLSLEEFEHEFAKGVNDFVYANPYLLLKEHDQQGYIPLVRDKTPVRGILVVRKDSAIRSPSELDGKKVAFPSPNALGAGLLLRADLDQLYKARVVPIVTRTHTSSYIHVINGLAEAGGGVLTTLAQQTPEIRDALRVLYTTRAVPSLPLAAHPRVPAAEREKVRRAMLALAATAEGKLLLARVPMPEPIAADIKEYLAMRAWHLDAYWVSDF
jgi:phosphonate transport system substrate-binding protein